MTTATAAAPITTGGARDPENTLYLQLKDGRVVIELRPDLAPEHVKRIKELARKGFYDGQKFHRVIEGFMAQTGDPTGTGTGGSGKTLPDEFSSAHYVRGTVGAASAGPNTSDSQFFICFKPAPFLDGQYTIFGQVVEGMEFVDNIARGEPPANPDKMISLKVAADVAAAPAATTPAAPAAH
ncbi:MAG: peptidylprolyl isomerase [Rhodospirillales bacterium 12-54-5]|nr:MAG: peptidylprolyl isomerase [Rhodospirillales bacterium 12-54-5]